MTNMAKFSYMPEVNGSTICENNMGIRHGYPIGLRVGFFYEKWDQKILAYVVGYQRDCDGEPLYVLSPDKTIVDKYPNWVNKIRNGDVEDQNFSRFEMMTNTILTGISASSISFQELVDPEEIRSKKWTYKHIHGTTFEIHFDIEVNEKYVEKFIFNNECPLEQVVPGTIYPVTSNEVKQNTENQIVSK